MFDSIDDRCRHNGWTSTEVLPSTWSHQRHDNTVRGKVKGFRFHSTHVRFPVFRRTLTILPAPVSEKYSHCLLPLDRSRCMPECTPEEGSWSFKKEEEGPSLAYSLDQGIISPVV